MDVRARSALRHTYRTRCRRATSFSTPSAWRRASMSATTSSVPKNARRVPSLRAQARTARAVGGVRSELAHLALQRLAVERAGARAALVEHDDAVLALLRGERAGDIAVEDRKPGLPGPPDSTRSTPFGARTLSPIPTWRCSVPRAGFARSSGTSSVAHVYPVTPGHAWELCRPTVRADADPATAKATTTSSTSRRTRIADTDARTVRRLARGSVGVDAADAE